MSKQYCNSYCIFNVNYNVGIICQAGFTLSPENSCIWMSDEKMGWEAGRVKCQDVGSFAPGSWAGRPAEARNIKFHFLYLLAAGELIFNKLNTIF